MYQTIVPVNATTQTIQAALNMGGEVVFPAGNGTMLTGPLKLVSFSRVIVDCTLQLAPGSNDNLFSGSGLERVVLEGMGMLDGDRAGQKTVNSGPPPWSGGVRLQNCWKARVRDLSIAAFSNWPVSVEGCAYTHLSGIQADACGNSLQIGMGSVFCRASGLVIRSLDDDGFASYGGTLNCGVTDSVVEGCSAGFVVLNDAGSPQPCIMFSIIGCCAFDNKSYGYVVQSGEGAVGGNHIGTVINGNRSYGNAKGDVWITDGTVVSIDGNVLMGPLHGGNILVQGPASYVVQGSNACSP